MNYRAMDARNEMFSDPDDGQEYSRRQILEEAERDADVEALELLDEEVLEIEEDEDESSDFDTRDREGVRDMPEEPEEFNGDDDRLYQSEQLLSKEFKG